MNLPNLRNTATFKKCKLGGGYPHVSYMTLQSFSTLIPRAVVTVWQRFLCTLVSSSLPSVVTPSATLSLPSFVLLYKHRNVEALSMASAAGLEDTLVFLDEEADLRRQCVARSLILVEEGKMEEEQDSGPLHRQRMLWREWERYQSQFSKVVVPSTSSLHVEYEGLLSQLLHVDENNAKQDQTTYLLQRLQNLHQSLCEELWSYDVLKSVHVLEQVDFRTRYDLLQSRLLAVRAKVAEIQLTMATSGM